MLMKKLTLIIILVLNISICLTQTNPCTKNPCKNGGECLSVLAVLGLYKCQCLNGFKGINCEKFNNNYRIETTLISNIDYIDPSTTTLYSSTTTTALKLNPKEILPNKTRQNNLKNEKCISNFLMFLSVFILLLMILIIYLIIKSKKIVNQRNKQCSNRAQKRLLSQNESPPSYEHIMLKKKTLI
ncbi:unnamed protein product [Brachionus calyciflorus]|uniref:EGF-like domain-containing protein n=1 Tax=Brachionus calyciflorus TaxID=104777 RepID=A0A813ZWU5_9BILA|nr:unnamed protein product [Brachionus calyciflorus]